MFKKFTNNKDKNIDEGFEQRVKQFIQPFDIDLKNLKRYNAPEMHEYIMKYEKCFTNMRTKLFDMHGILQSLQKEKNQQIEESEQYRLQVDNLKLLIQQESKQKQPPSKLEDIQTDIHDLRKKISNFHGILQENESILTNDQVFTDFQKSIGELVDNLDKHVQNVELQSNTQQSKETQSQIEEYQKQSQKKEIQLEEYIQKNDILSKKSQEHEAFVIQSNEKTDILLKDNQHLNVENMELIKDLNNIKQEFNQLKEEHQNLQTSHQEGQEKMTQDFQEKLNKQTSVLENKIVQERIKLDQKNRDFSKLEESYQELKKELNQQIENLNSQQKKYSLLEQHMDQKKKGLQEIKNILKIKQEKINDLEQDISQNQSKFESQLQQKQLEYYKLQQEIHSQTGKNIIVETIDLQKELNFQQMKIQNQELQEQLNKLQKQMEEQNYEISQEKQIMDDKDDQIKYLTQKREQSIILVESLNSQVQKLQKGPILDKSSRSSYSKLQEKGFLQVIQLELQHFLKNFYQVIPQTNQNYVSFQRDFNDLIRKVSEFIEILEEFEQDDFN